MTKMVIQHLASENTLGRFYILSPENSCSVNDNFNTIDFEEVFQYGSSPTNANLWEVDGIAVQCEDYNKMPLGNSIYLEDYPAATEEYRNFLDAHYNTNYGWIFSAITGGKGLVKTRN